LPGLDLISDTDAKNSCIFFANKGHMKTQGNPRSRNGSGDFSIYDFAAICRNPLRKKQWIEVKFAVKIIYNSWEFDASRCTPSSGPACPSGRPCP
jgi:hypothetical protein